ncbi:MAG TPA: glycosyltransferase [Planctomycetaceae bacterium]|nr:glycosyltransferase [Planctomycetaceae bacterium]HQZ67656.1 glycosyltransferase [Planctomycetaceae bacterium]
MKVAILHQLPIEYYPPLTNALNYFAGVQDVQVLAVTCNNEKGRAPYSQPRIELRRYPFAVRGDSFFHRWKKAFAWHWAAAKAIAVFQPDVVMYFEPHSALAAFLFFWWFRGKARFFIHHHEYYTPGDYRQPGNRLTRLNHFFERRYLLPRADWISQTNSDRLRFFQADHPKVRPEQLHVFPNYPPASWGQREDHSNNGRADRARRLRLVYVGSVSLHDTFIGPLVEWLVSHPEFQIQLDVYAYNCDLRTAEFLRKARGDVVRFHEKGIGYDDLPDLLRKFDVGVILYRCNTVNFQYNASNKLFEYLTCGLDVWYPGTMLGVKPYATSDVFPRVVEVDFENMDALDLAELRSRDGLAESPWRESCEGELAKLEAEMRQAGKSHQ